MKKYLLSFLLISLTVISDGYAGSCKAYSKRDTYKNTDNDFLDLMCEENKKTEVESDGYTGYDVEKFDYWGIDCVTDSNSCAGDQHVIVWGKHKKGNEKGVYTGVDIYKCIDKADDEWDALTKGYDKAYQLINDCGSTVEGMTKVVSTNGYDIYVRVIDAFSRCETRAYTFASMSSSYICKKAADVAEKKCGKTPDGLGNSVLVEKNDGGDVKTWYATNGAFAETKKDTITINTLCDSLNNFSEFVKFGSWNSMYDIYVKEKLSKTGCFNVSNPYSSETNNNWSFTDVCLKCKDGTSYDQSKNECVSDSGGGDSGGGDSSAESQVVEEICGVQCNSGMNGKSIFCAKNKEDTYVYKCDSGHWSEVDVYGYCCNKNCSKPKKTNFDLGGSWTTDTGHEMWFSPTALINKDAWLFNSPDVNKNCTACKEGTTYNKNSGKCEQ